MAALQHGKKKLLGHCLLGSAFLNYLGPFTREFRNRLLYKDWFDNLVDDEVSFYYSTSSLPEIPTTSQSTQYSLKSFQYFL